MKKIVKLLLLFVVPLLLVSCSDDEYEDLQIPGKTIEEPVKLTGHVYNEDETWYLGTKLPVINMDRGEGAEIKIKSFPNNISLDEIEYIEKTFTVKLTLYDVNHHISGLPYEEYPVVMYYYVADIYEIE